jgi:hypothetical protein
LTNKPRISINLKGLQTADDLDHNCAKAANQTGLPSLQMECLELGLAFIGRQFELAFRPGFGLLAVLLIEFFRSFRLCPLTFA